MLNTVVKFIVSVVVALLAYQYFAPTSKTATKREDVTTVKANALLEKHAELYGTEKIVKVTDQVYVAVGFSLANMIMLEGSDGIIIVDCTESPDTSRKILKEFRKITKKPLKAIIITHFHGDHIIGAQAVLDASRENGINVRVFTHSSTTFENFRFMASSDIGYTRTSRQFGTYLSRGSEHIDSGIGPKLHMTPESSYDIISATDTFDNEAAYNIAGIKFTLLHTPGETNDQITVWIPEWRVVLPADNVYESFPNLYAIRGSPPRNLEIWCRSLDKVRHLRAQYMVPSHTNPLEGEDEIFDVITHYRDAIQFINDQTIRLMNEGVDLDEIVERVRLPPTLASHRYLQEHYGTVAWSVRSAYSGQMGWFDGDPVNLYRLSKKKQAIFLDELLSTDFGTVLSGKEKMLMKAKQCLQITDDHFKTTGLVKNDELQWALELSFDVLKLGEGSKEFEDAKKVAISSLRSLAMFSANSNARNYYLTYAKELESGLILALSTKAKSVAIRGLRVSDVMAILPYRFIAESCDDTAVATVIFSFPDLKEDHSFTMRHCILEHNTEPSRIPKEFDAKLTVSSDVWKDVVSNTRSAIGALASGDLILEGSMISFKRFMDLLVKA